MIADSEFESPLFKVLAKNDTGEGKGHVGGFVLPKPLRKYFPVLNDPTVDVPTPDVPLRAILVDGPVRFGEVQTRYQLQSWGATRKGETRITGAVDQLLGTAGEDDLLLIERKADAEDLYRLTLVRKQTESYSVLIGQIGESRWGVLPGFQSPVDNSDIEHAESELSSKLSGKFEPFGAGEKVLTSSLRIARSRAFSRLVISAHNSRCAICGGGLKGIDGRSELEAAHIIGKGHNGSDDVRNGLCLCRSDHWAFDNFVLSVDSEMKLQMRPEAAAFSQNKRLLDLVGKPINLPTDPSKRPHQTALKWHFDRVFSD